MTGHRLLRGALVALALLFLAWEAYGAMRWLVDAGGIGQAGRQFWTHLTADWMLLLVLTDHLLLAGIGLVMMWLDANRAGWALSRRLGLAAAFVVFGSPVVLLYLAWRLRGTTRWSTPSGAAAGG
jgi:hypothetical protein